jgi:hypothetical protein
MKAQRITIRRVNQQHGMLPEDTQGRKILLMRIVKGRNGFESEHLIVFNHPSSPRMSASGFTHYAVLPGYLIP